MYTTEDLIDDLLQLTEKQRRSVVIMNYDKLVEKIHRKHGGRVAMRTIMNKLWKLKKAGLIKIRRRRRWDRGIVEADKAEVVIYRTVLKSASIKRTIALEGYLNGLGAP